MQKRPDTLATALPIAIAEGKASLDGDCKTPGNALNHAGRLVCPASGRRRKPGHWREYRPPSMTATPCWQALPISQCEPAGSQKRVPTHHEHARCRLCSHSDPPLAPEVEPGRAISTPVERRPLWLELRKVRGSGGGGWGG